MINESDNLPPVFEQKFDFTLLSSKAQKKEKNLFHKSSFLKNKKVEE